MNLTSNARGRQVQPSGLHPSPGFHRYDIPARPLCVIIEEDTQDPWRADCDFVVTTPEVRCRVKLDLIYVPAPPAYFPVDFYWGTLVAPDNRFEGIGLWLCKRGEAGVISCRERLENLYGSYYLGEVVDPGCMGYHVEIDSCAEELWGRLTVVGPDEGPTRLPAGKWYARAALHAYEQFTDDEWKRAYSRFDLRVEHGGLVTNFHPT